VQAQARRSGVGRCRTHLRGELARVELGGQLRDRLVADALGQVPARVALLVLQRLDGRRLHRPVDASEDARARLGDEEAADQPEGLVLERLRVGTRGVVWPAGS